MTTWDQAGDTLHAPSLLRFEVANALAQSVAASAITAADADAAWEDILSLPVTLHELENGRVVLAIAAQLRRKSAYDAAYVALAQELDTDVWTLDGPLARNAVETDLPVRLLV